MTDVGDPRQVQSLSLFLQPAQWVGVTLDLSKDVQDDIHQAAVVPACRQHVQQGGKGTLRVHFLIPGLQDPVQRPLHEHGAVLILT